jgi:hypothetical protein
MIKDIKAKKHAVNSNAYPITLLPTKNVKELEEKSIRRKIDIWNILSVVLAKLLFNVHSATKITTYKKVVVKSISFPKSTKYLYF